MKVLYASSEALPFAASGGLADVAGSLPRALRGRKIACRVVMPYYSTISEELKAKCKYLLNFTVELGWRKQYCGVFTANVGGVVYYLLDNEYYFKRNNLYGEFDDGERFAFFSKAVLDLISYIDFKPDIIHCNDWQTGLIPVYLNAFYRNIEKYRYIKTIFTIHNIQYQGKFSSFVAGDVFGLSDNFNNILEYDGCINVLKAAMQESDRITTVSDSYSKEILSPAFAFGLSDFLNNNSFKLSGILNGIDMELYNPRTDKKIAANFSENDLSGKEKCKEELLKEFGLSYKKDTPVIAMVTRLVEAKGISLVREVFEKLMTRDVRFILLGSGDKEYEEFFEEMRRKYPEKVGVYIGFSPKTASKVYAGADIFLMPSLSEPCGLAQMVALLYGTIPIIHEVGGLRDTIKDCSLGEGNGFTFNYFHGDTLLNTIDNALRVYGNKEDWKKLMETALKSDFSWKKSADKYINTYKEL